MKKKKKRRREGYGRSGKGEREWMGPSVVEKGLILGEHVLQSFYQLGNFFADLEIWHAWLPHIETHGHDVSTMFLMMSMYEQHWSRVKLLVGSSGDIYNVSTSLLVICGMKTGNTSGILGPSSYHDLGSQTYSILY